MKKNILIFLLIIFVIPSIAFASWWNPFSWFNGWNFHKTEITTENPAQKNTLPNITTTNDISNKVTIPPVSTKQNNFPVAEKTTPQKDTTQPQQVIQIVPPPIVITPPQQPIVSIPPKTNDQKCEDQYGINSNWTGQVNSQGGPTCGCRSGYALNSNNICGVQKTGYKVCSDSYQNETWDGTYGSDGKYNCVCQTGYVWDNNQSSCQENNQTTQNNNSYKVCQQQTKINALNQQIIDIKTQYYKEVAGAQTTGTSVVAQGEVNRLTNEANQKIAQINLQIQQLQLNCQ